jgi:hypothetical protein
VTLAPQSVAEAQPGSGRAGAGHSLCIARVPGQRAASRGAAHGPGVRAARGVGGAWAGTRAAQEAGPPVGHGAGVRPGRPRRGQRTPRQEAAPKPAGRHGAASARAGVCAWHPHRRRPWEEEAARLGAGTATPPPRPPAPAACVRGLGYPTWRSSPRPRKRALLAAPLIRLSEVESPA